MQHLINLLMHRYNFWRHIKFSELGELYVTMTLKTFALSMIGIFVPVYLYELGFSLMAIAGYYAFYFGIRIPLDLLFGYVVARYGAKHAISYSYIVLLCFMGMLISMESVAWPLGLLALLHAVSIGLFYLGYHVDFSAVKKGEVVGKELTTMFIVVKMAAAVGPFIGGYLATRVNIQFTIGLAFIMVAIAAWPLMLSVEPIKPIKGFKINFKRFKKYTRSALAYTGLGLDQTAALSLWPLYLGVFIFTDNIYFQLGLVTSASAIVSIFVAKIIGDMVDNKQGQKLLGYSSLLLAIANGLRTIVSNSLQIIGVNIMNEWSSTGVQMPFIKGFYDEADTASDRISYLSIMESIVSGSRMVFWLLLLLLLGLGLTIDAFKILFFVAGMAAIMINVQNFRSLR
jgi:MFS family permease